MGGLTYLPRPLPPRNEHRAALNVLDSLLRNYDRRATPTNHLGEPVRIASDFRAFHFRESMYGESTYKNVHYT